MRKIRILMYVVMVCSILLVAVFFPNIVSQYLQKSLEDRVSYIDVGVKTYEVKYNNIWEKIASIQKCIEEEDGLNIILIATEITEDLKETLTKYVTEQFNQIQDGIFYNISKFRKENLVSCEKYAIYSSSEANGISFWKLKYQTDKENIQILMDTEFNCVYFFHLVSKSSIAKKCFDKVYRISENGQDYNMLVNVDHIWKYFGLEKADVKNNKIFYVEPSLKNEIFTKNNISIYYTIYCREDTGDIVMSSSNMDGAVMDDVKQYGSMTDKTITGISCVYKSQWSENKGEMELSSLWGVAFFLEMMQL